AMYRHHFGAGSHELVAGDVHSLDSASLPDLELATASFPCTDLSLAGSRHGLEGASSSAFWGFIKVLKNLGHRRPPLVLLENVTGFLTSHGGGDFRNALLALNDLGYSVDTFQIDAANFVPQSRQRLFVVGTKTKAGAETSLQDGFLESDVRPAALADFIFTNPDIRWNVRTLPRLPKRRHQLDDIIEDVPLNSEIWWSRERADYLLSQMSPKHRAEAQRMMDGKAWSFATVFRRVRNGRSMAELRNDGVAGCLRTPRGGSGRQILFQAGQGSFHVRLVTPRECARLMGAPQFKIEATLNQALFGFGDAVCVPVIQWIARHYLSPALNELCPQQASGQPELIRAGKISY
ncbi:MAG: DNA (cytosine-5-)-methyltransferase, partial [Verrucomicrobiaceae bacterium]